MKNTRGSFLYGRVVQDLLDVTRTNNRSRLYLGARGHPGFEPWRFSVSLSKRTKQN